MAASAYFSQIQQAYLAYYGRPADPAGLQYWATQLDNAKGNLNVIINAFGSSAESTALYSGSSPAAQVNTIYNTLFGRDADLAGLNFYVSGLQNGTFTLASVALNVYNGASGTDKTALDNKLVYANSFTTAIDTTTEVLGYSGTAAAILARAAVSAVKDAATLATATTGLDVSLATVTQAGNAGASAGQTLTLTEGVDTIVGTANNDTITATNTTAKPVLGGLDSVDGGAGVDTLAIADTVVAPNADFTLPAGFTIKNVEKLNVTTNGAIGTGGAAGAVGAFDVSGIAGLTSVNLVAAGAGTAAGSHVKAAGTTDVALTVSGDNTATVDGGKAVTIVAGATISAPVKGAVAVTGKDLTSVSIKGGGVATVDNTGGAAGTTTAVGTTLTSVTLDGVAGATAALKGAAISTVTVQNQATALATSLTNDTSTALTVNVANVGYDAAGNAVAGVSVAAGSKAATITVNATGAKSNVSVSGAVATTVNITGSADLTLAPVATATKLDGSAATGKLTLGDLAAGTVTVSTGSGNDSFAIQATAKTTVNAGAGDDVVTLKSAIAAGSTINLGAGNDKLLSVGGSVAASTATDVTVIDAGDGIDTVSASLINAANAAQFKNFENLDLTAAANLDVNLMTGSTITGLTLSGSNAASTVTNVAAGVGLSVTGDNSAATATIGVKGAATNTADVFNISFNGAAATTAPAGATVKADVKLANIEAVNVASTGAANTWNALKLDADSLQKLVITGDKNLDLTFGNAGKAVTGVTDTVNGLSLVDGSAATGKLAIDFTTVGTINVANAGLTVKGGSANDTITLTTKATVDAGAGDDVIKSALAGGTFTGGAGKDSFDVKLAIGEAAKLTEATGAFKTTVTDFAAGDSIVFANAVGATATKVALDISVTNLDGAVAKATAGAAGVTWFQYGSDTYIVENDGTAGFGIGDTVVKLTGLIDLSHATLAGSTVTMA
ncbi:DUF4214 domain-containing protein [Cupriavidus basilensis]|uniref:DUF4214 domain-containing protein n=1 Tax=Cupriavidus basilensis TaxID=68895 RepID=UPI0023E7AEE5|nr:DUF4214 domain-containing protein [Cupriavidus basilensis]MDF3886720.1 DUF4214 domain-containing protein [Cupriavidus basilensis]